MILVNISGKAVKLYLSFSNKDKKLADTLIQQLEPLQQHGLIESSHQSKMVAGSHLQNVVEEYLNQADIILLLLSPDFSTSEQCCSVERRAMERYENEGIHVIPILLRPFDWKTLPCSKFQCLPFNSEAVTLWKNRDAAFSSIVEGIRKVVLEVKTLASSLIAEGKTPQSWNIPHRRNPFFTGREELVTQLYNNFMSATLSVQEQVLTGLVLQL